MSNTPDAKLVSGAWNKETKRFEKEWGAAWVKEWNGGGFSLSFKAQEDIPAGTFLKLNINKFGRLELNLKTGMDEVQEKQINEQANVPDLDDDLPF